MVRRKFREAFSIYRIHFRRIVAIVWSIYIPVNLITGYLEHELLTAENRFRFMTIDIYLNAFFDPICTGAVIHLLLCDKISRTTGYFRTMWMGLREGFGILVARLVAGLFILAGLCCFLFPGILLIVRYSLIDSIVVLEKAGQATARRRSSLLTRNHKWAILRVQLILLAGSLLLPILLELPAVHFESLHLPLVSVVTDCVLELFYPFATIVLFLFYWEAKSDVGRPKEGSIERVPRSPVLHDTEMK
ncbi:MAG: hypothetical protein ACOZF0_07795 [Thermodesulfobacteriota bacterium]